MLLVYEAENLIDGQLALDELRAGGLQAVMKGQYLSGAVGETNRRVDQYLDY